MNSPQFDNYKKTFVQRRPRYAVKHPGSKRWTTKRKPLSDKPIIAHLDGQYFVGVLGQWYPRYAVIDIDDRPIEIVNKIRESIGLNDSNSMLFDSESKDSYHLILKPLFNEKPPTIKRLQSAFKSFSHHKNIEIYPQVSRVIRLPLGAHQNSADLNYYHLKNWQDKLFWYDKLDEFDLSLVEGQQLSMDLQTIACSTVPNILQEGKELLDHGLQMPSSRNDSQFKILYYLWRLNVPQDQAEHIVYRWIMNKHNGFSKDIIRHPQSVRKEINRQANRIYSKYELSLVYPDTTHNYHHGYIAEPDIREVIKICKASLSRMRLLFQIVKFCYPRKHRDSISIHRDRLVRWSSSETYMKYLNEFEASGILKRGSVYLPGFFSKNIKLNWPYKSSDDAVLYEGRSVDTFEDTVRLLYESRELRELLIYAGADKGYVSRYLKGVYES